MTLSIADDWIELDGRRVGALSANLDPALRRWLEEAFRNANRTEEERERTIRYFKALEANYELPVRRMTAHTDAEHATLRRCRDRKPVKAVDLLMLVSTEMLIMQDQVNNIYRLAETYGLSLGHGTSQDLSQYVDPDLSQELWDDLNALYIDLPSISEYCQRWRAKKTGEPERQTVEWRPSSFAG